MKFQVIKKESPECITLHLQGELDLSTAPKLREAIDKEIGREDKELQLNLRGLEYMDSTGLGVMIAMLKARDQLSASVSVIEVPRKIQRLFDITGVSKFLTVSN